MYKKLQNTELNDLILKYPNQEILLEHIDKLITTQKKEIKNHKDEYDRLNVIIDLIPNTISWVNRDMTYFGVNKALADTCGVAPSEFTGKKIGFHTKEKFFTDFVTDLFATQLNTIYRELTVHIGDSTHSYLVSGTKLDDQNRAVVIGVDITELTLLKGHVSFTEKLATLGEMFAGIIHDINNPLMMIEGTVARIKKKIENEEVHDLLDKIDMSSKKISKIVQGIKIYIRNDGSVPFQNEELGSILDDALIICENKLKSKEVKLSFDKRIQSLKINCNFTQIFQVFVNLISNSVDAIGDFNSKWIDIKLLSDEGEFIKIQFQDSGDGIPLEHQNKIFNAFYSTKERGVGSGLGLALCTKILEAHGGKLSLDNSQSHTTFILEFKK